MPRLKDPNKLAAAIRDRIDITDGIDAIYVKAGLSKPKWRRSGAGEWKIVCPFHNDHDPSLDVNNAKGLYRCRAASCQRVKADGTPTEQAGDLITFAREYMHWTFLEAMRFFCELVDINIEDWFAEATEEEKAQAADRTKLEKMIAGCEPLNEWQGKFLSPAVLRDFEVREAPGHIKVSKDGRIIGWDARDEDDYVILPVRGDDGELVGWTTRRMSSSRESKQNPANWICNDPAALYGLHLVRPQLHKYGHRLIAVEGQTDALALHSAGIENAVALRGANLQEPHWRSIRHWNVRELTLCLDGDEGGRKGTERACVHFWNDGPVLSVAELPDDSDPESFLREHDDPLPLMMRLTRGKGEGRLIDSAEYLLRGEEEHFDTSTLSGRRAFIDRALHDLKMSHAEGYRRKLIVGWLAERFNMPTLQIMDMFTDEATPVSTVSAEQAVLARAMNEPNWAAQMFTRLSDDDFQYARHQLLWRILRQAQQRGIDCTDLSTLQEFAQRHGFAKEVTDQEFLTEILSFYRPGEEFWVETMIDGTLRRQVIQAANVLRTELANANVDAEQATASFSASVMSTTMWASGGAYSMSKEDKAKETMELVEHRMNNPDEIVGHDLGPQFPDLNLSLRGVRKGRLHVVAAGQSVGKTTFLDNWACHFAVHQLIPTLFVGLEMDYTEYNTRLLAQMTGIDASRIDSGRISEPERDRVARAAVRLAEAPLWIETPDTMDMEQLVMLCRSYKLSHGIEAVFYDYTQLTEPTRHQRRMSRYEMMGELVKCMKLQIARGMDVAFIAAAQMNRESSKDKKNRSTAEGVGDSYMISQTADTFMILTEGEHNANLIDLFIDKNRQGRKDILIPLHFDGPSQIMREFKDGSKVPAYRVQ